MIEMPTYYVTCESLISNRGTVGIVLSLFQEGTFNFGNTGDDPIKNVRFYTKEKPNEAIDSDHIPVN